MLFVDNTLLVPDYPLNEIDDKKLCEDIGLERNLRDANRWDIHINGEIVAITQIDVQENKALDILLGHITKCFPQNPGLSEELKDLKSKDFMHASFEARLVFSFLANFSQHSFLGSAQHLIHDLSLIRESHGTEKRDNIKIHFIQEEDSCYVKLDMINYFENYLPMDLIEQARENCITVRKVYYLKLQNDKLNVECVEREVLVEDRKGNLLNAVFVEEITLAWIEKPYTINLDRLIQLNLTPEKKVNFLQQLDFSQLSPAIQKKLISYSTIGCDDKRKQVTLRKLDVEMVISASSNEHFLEAVSSMLGEGYSIQKMKYDIPPLSPEASAGLRQFGINQASSSTGVSQPSLTSYSNSNFD